MYIYTVVSSGIILFIRTVVGLYRVSMGKIVQGI